MGADPHARWHPGPAGGRGLLLQRGLRWPACGPASVARRPTLTRPLQDAADAIVDEVGVAEDMLDFLQTLLAAHPELAQLDFFVTGESCAARLAAVAACAAARREPAG